LPVGTDLFLLRARRELVGVAVVAHDRKVVVNVATRFTACSRDVSQVF
jgi:hypothetical protein